MNEWTDHTPPEERVYAKVKRPYDFGAIALVNGKFDVAPARVESQYPNAFRMARYPDGSVRVQGMYAWHQGNEGGTYWKDIPLVDVDDKGNLL